MMIIKKSGINGVKIKIKEAFNLINDVDIDLDKLGDEHDSKEFEKSIKLKMKMDMLKLYNKLLCDLGENEILTLEDFE